MKYFEKNRRIFFIFLSIIFHILIFNIFQIKRDKVAYDENYKIIEMVIIEKDRQQIVDRQEKANEKMPVKESFLSNKNNAVDSETKSKLNHLPQINKGRTRQKKESQSYVLSETGNKVTYEKLKDSLYDFEKLTSKIMPSFSSDYLPNINESDMNSLNTREFLYFSYYERIKQRLGMFWTPALETQFRRLAVASIRLEQRDLITKLIIVLDNEGYIRKIEKISSSGFTELDDAAVEAFNKASPFLNPPKGILDEDNKLILKWDFILKS